ncbi:MAG: 5'-nucleotidase C-terminal domain-containing protein [Treponema sp.]|nr:5'-nucleotidase C-terminal domain-containing protein [Treponema sp.]
MKKRFLFILFLAALVLSPLMARPATDMDLLPKSKRVTQPAMQVPAAQPPAVQTPAGQKPAAGAKLDFQILFTSDIHGCFSDWSYSTNTAYTGLARIATKINELRNDKTILIDVGDSIQGNGTSVFNTSAWDNAPENTQKMYPTIQGFQYLKYDAWVLGNHEFNFGMDRLDKAYGKGQGPGGTNAFTGKILAGNVYKDGKPAFDSFFVKRIGGDTGPNVAIVSMTHPNIVNWDAGNLTPYGYTTRPADDVTKETIDYLKTPAAEAIYGKIDIFIAAQHMSNARETDKGSGAVDVIAMNGSDLSLFIGAHGHLNQDMVIDGVRYVELGANGARLGQVTITATSDGNGGWKVADKVNDTKMNNIVIGTSGATLVNADAGYKNALSAPDAFGKNYANTVIGRLDGGPLVPAPELNDTYQAYMQDNALVHLINDAMIYYTQSYGVTLSGTAPLDTNANALPGPLTRGSVSTIYKYDNNTLCVVEMTGAQFKQWMEWAYLFIGPYKGDGGSNFELGAAMKPGDLTIPYGNGNMPGYNMDQFSGLSYKVDLTKPYGQKIVEMKNPDGSAFDLNKTYRVAVNNYRVDSQLSINAAESSRPAVFPAGKDTVKVIAREVDSNLTVNGVTKQNGEGMLGLMVDYIDRVKGGVITNQFTPNWSYITPPIEPVLRDKAIQLVNSGKINLIPLDESIVAGAQTGGKNYARRAVTVDDVAANLTTIDIFSFNDFHGTVDKSASASNPGADRFAAVVQELMKKNPSSILLSAGDNYQGSPLSNVFYGEPVSAVFKAFGMNISAVGNHEFDWGTQYIQKFADDGNVTFLSANIFYKGTDTRPDLYFAKPYQIVTVGGKKIGIIGLTTTETPNLVKAEIVKDLEFREPGPWLNTMISDLKTNQGCDFVIALAHMGAVQDPVTGVITGEAADLARTCPGFDAIISGHSHTLVAGYVNNIPIVQGNYNGRGLGRLTIGYDNGKYLGIYPRMYTQNNMNTADILPVGPPLVVNEQVKNIIAGFQDRVGPLFSQVVGKYGVDINDRDGQAAWATKIVYDFIKRTTGDSYITVQNAGGWRDTSPYNRKAADDVTLGYLYTLMPFDNEIVLLQMKGKDILYMLGSPNPALISDAIVAGAYKQGDTWYDSSTNQAIDPAKTYNVACNDFMLTGGDNFPFPASSQGNAAGVEKLGNPSFMGVPLRDAMVQELKFRAGIASADSMNTYLLTFIQLYGNGSLLN